MSAIFTHSFCPIILSVFFLNVRFFVQFVLSDLFECAIFLSDFLSDFLPIYSNVRYFCPIFFNVRSFCLILCPIYFNVEIFVPCFLTNFLSLLFECPNDSSFSLADFYSDFFLMSE